MEYSPPSYTPPRLSLPYWHPRIDASYGAGTAVPAGHPLVLGYLAADAPASHADADKWLADPRAHPMPWYHPALDP